MNDKLILAEEEQQQENADSDVWKVLIVDDEEDVHDVTKLVLKGFSYKERGIHFLSAYSTKDGKVLLDEHKDIALILLDIVMENDSSGFELIDFIRKERGINDIRVILRTGQPGAAPERKVIDVYDIDGYTTKSELTSDKLYSLIRSGLKNFHDIKYAEETQRKLVTVETMAKLRENLTSMIIHDLKNPLSIIMSIFGIWKHNKLFESDGTRNQFNLACRACDTISDMVIEQLKLSQLESGKYVIQPEPVDLNHLIYLLYCDTEQEFNEHLLFEYFTFPKSFPKLNLDKELVRRVITNLLSNAIRYTKEGVIEIRCQYQKKNKLLVITVADTGVGIKSEDVPKLFDQYYQAENSKRGAKNFGIGLSFCDFAVKAMGGDITVKSVLGEGTEFRLEIPAEQSDGVCLEIENDVSKRIVGKRKGPEEKEEGLLQENLPNLPLRVLLVDDSKTIRRIMRMFLENIGVNNIDEARNGQGALDKMLSRSYDVVFLDIMMPVMSGLEVVALVRPKYPDLPIVMLTAEHLKQDEADELGVSSYITKPFSFEKIQETLKVLKLIPQDGD